MILIHFSTPVGAIKNCLKALFFLALLYSCNNTSQPNEQVHSKHTVVDDIAKQPIEPQELQEETSSIDFIEGAILLPSAYRITEENEIGKILENKNWLEIFEKDGNFTIDIPSYELINEDEEPCSGMPQQIIKSKRNTLIFINIPHVKSGKIEGIHVDTPIISPKKDLEFSFHNEDYVLIASGADFTENSTYDRKNVQYKLQLFTKEGTLIKTLIDQKEYNDTDTSLKFIGDIDQDGKPDFIFSSPRDYEEERYILILSNPDTYYEEARQFDC